MLTENWWLCGATDKVSDYESGNSKFVSWQGRNILSHTKIDFIPNIYCHYYLPQISGHVAQWKRHLTTNRKIPGYEFWQGRNILSQTKIDFIPNIYCHYYLTQIRGLILSHAGPMEKASDYESGFQDWEGRNILSGS